MNNPQIERILSRLDRVQATSDGSWMACCPAHDDRNPSLSINLREDGRVLLHCFSGCETEQVLAAADLSWQDLFAPETLLDRAASSAPPPRSSTGDRTPTEPTSDQATFSSLDAARMAYVRKLGEPAACWEYRDADGTTIGAVFRWDRPSGKQIRPAWRFQDGWRLTYPASRPLYGADRIKASERVFVVEGEKAAEAMHRLGLPATTSPGGALAADRADWATLQARDVVILPDADEPGERYAEAVAARMRAGGRTVAVLRLPGLAPDSGHDVVEWIATHQESDGASPAEKLQRLADAALAREHRSASLLNAREILSDPSWRDPPRILRSGVPWFDGIQPFGGLEPGTLTVIAAPPRCFKTALLLYLAWNFALQGHRVHYLAGEMTRRALMRRLVAMAARVSTATVTNAATLPENRAVEESIRSLSELGDHLAFGRAPITIGEIRRSAESAEIVIVDYLQLIQPAKADLNAGRSEQLESTMSEILAIGQQGATIIAAAALNRAKRDESSLGSIRGSSAIEYGASTIYATSESLCGLDQPSPIGASPYQSVEYRCLKQREGAAMPLLFELALDFGPLPVEPRA